MKANTLEDYKINIKIKLSILWASVTLFYLYGDYFELYIPQKTQGLITGDNLLDSPTNLFLAALLLAIPAVMVVLSILLKPTINRILNIVFVDQNHIKELNGKYRKKDNVTDVLSFHYYDDFSLI